MQTGCRRSVKILPSRDRREAKRRGSPFNTLLVEIVIAFSSRDPCVNTVVYCGAVCSGLTVCILSVSLTLYPTLYHILFLSVYVCVPEHVYSMPHSNLSSWKSACVYNTRFIANNIYSSNILYIISTFIKVYTISIRVDIMCYFILTHNFFIIFKLLILF